MNDPAGALQHFFDRWREPIVLAELVAIVAAVVAALVFVRLGIYLLRLMQFSDSGMDLELRFWIADPENGVNNVRSDVNRSIWRLFREAGITIPVAQREIRVRPEGDALQ